MPHQPSHSPSPDQQATSGSTEPPDPRPTQALFAALRSWLNHRFSLSGDQAGLDDIDTRFRDGVEFRGTNVWLLVIAIFVASVGLNVNSTAVIIGAMLISPLMGPIMGIGYGVGRQDFALIKRAFRNLWLAVVISLMTAAVYFFLSPLKEAQSELLARTSPSLWDLIIALFGGLAGAVGITRKEKSNVIPGVAIATALMPPLCTAGFGLASGQLPYFLGALYLFFINSVFIALATIVVVRLMALPLVEASDVPVQRRLNRLVSAVVALTALPSVWLTVQLVRQEVFVASAKRFVKAELDLPGVRPTDPQWDPVQRQIEVTLLGEQVGAPQLDAIRGRLERYGLAGTKLVVHQMGQKSLDVPALRSSVLADLYRDSAQRAADKEAQLQALQQRLTEAELAHAAQLTAAREQEKARCAEAEQQAAAGLQAAEARRALSQAVARELLAQVPLATDVTIGQAEAFHSPAEPPTLVWQVEVGASQPLPPERLEALLAWLRVRLQSASVALRVTVSDK